MNIIAQIPKLTFSFILIICLTVSAQSGDFVSVKGTKIITPDGAPILLKGINLGNWMVPEGYMFGFKKISSPRLIHDFFNVLMGETESKKFWNFFREHYITRDDIYFIKDAGFNSIRIPFHYNLFVDDYGTLQGPGYALMDSAVAWSAEAGLYVILDMHCAPGGQTGDNIDDSYGYPFLFESDELMNLTAKVWVELARHYADNTTVIGYDLLNEPIAHYFDKEHFNPKLEPFFKMLTAEIRKVDENHLIFLGGAQWNSNFSVFGKPFDDKLVYTFHKYWTAASREVITDYIDYSVKYNVPLYLGESGENTNEWIEEFRITLETDSIGWCFWPYKKMNSTRGVVSIPKPEEWDSIAVFADSFDVSFGFIRENKPARQLIQKAFAEYMNNLKLKNCSVNDAYLKALGMRAPGKK